MCIAVFNEIINQLQVVFEDIKKIREKKQGGIIELYITFYADMSDYKDEYVFFSRSEEGEHPGFTRYKTWRIRHDGTSEDYVPRQQL